MKKALFLLIAGALLSGVAAYAASASPERFLGHGRAKELLINHKLGGSS